MDKTTIIYLEKNNQYLMLHRNKKEKDINKDKWIGVGGHIEENETNDQCIVREVKEETNLDLIDFKLKGEVVSTIQEYGINSALIEIKLCVSGKSSVLLPLKTKAVDISLSVPLAVKIIHGQIPDYYIGSSVVGGVN